MTTLDILCIGDELLDGRVQDTNSHVLAGIATSEGLRPQSLRVIPDEIPRIHRALLETDADVVVISGGLGPTADDVTRDAAALFAGTDLQTDEELLQELRQRFADRGYPFTENNARQCAFPASARVLPTRVGSAAGFSLTKDGRHFLFFPGVPSEFRWFVHHHLLPVHAPGLSQGRSQLVFFGLGESALETRIAPATELATSLGVRVGYRASRSLIEVSLKGPDDDRLAVEAAVRSAIGAFLVAESGQTFLERLAGRLIDAGATVTVAESCTGGLVGAALTEIPGSSAFFQQGFLTYSNQAKIDLLGVLPETLERHGAVSPEVVSEMARGARRAASSTFSLAISGIAGPSGGTPDKPVGTVDFALDSPDGLLRLRRRFPGSDRARIRGLAVHTSLAILLWHLEGRLAAHEPEGPL